MFKPTRPSPKPNWNEVWRWAHDTLVALGYDYGGSVEEIDYPTERHDGPSITNWSGFEHPTGARVGLTLIQDFPKGTTDEQATALSEDRPVDEVRFRFHPHHEDD
jgi:hypothetical protein